MELNYDENSTITSETVETATAPEGYYSVPSMQINIQSDQEKLGNYEYVNHPTHYNQYCVEAYDMVSRVFYPNDPEGMAKFCEATAFLYRLRLGTKPENPIEQELKKESWWLKTAKEYRTNK